jgi:Protein of unknown function (DUF3485)
MPARFSLLVVVVVALTVVPAILEGKYLNRWGTPSDLDAAAGQIEQLPHELGPWLSQQDGEPLSPAVRQELALAGSISRTYVHRETGAVVNLLLMVGQPGPLLRHPPDICYANRANEQVGDTITFEVTATNPSSKFDLLEYKRPQSLTTDRFLVAYSMATSATWSVPRVPRMEFGGASKLYKVQILTSLESAEDHQKGVADLQQFANSFCNSFDQLLTKPQQP